jgi:predicted nucleic acid-binding protein
MTIVDTSSWIEALRENGKPEVRARVKNLLDFGQPVWCAVIRLELWRGVRAGAERHVLELFETRIKSLEIGPEVWKASVALMVKARAAGLTAPVTDVVIAATAKHHGAQLEHCDQHLEQLMNIA